MHGGGSPWEEARQVGEVATELVIEDCSPRPPRTTVSARTLPVQPKHAAAVRVGCFDRQPASGAACVQVWASSVPKQRRGRPRPRALGRRRASGMASPVQMALLGYDSGFVAPAGCRGSLIVSKVLRLTWTGSGRQGQAPPGPLGSPLPGRQGRSGSRTTSLRRTAPRCSTAVRPGGRRPPSCGLDPRPRPAAAFDSPRRPGRRRRPF